MAQYYRLPQLGITAISVDGVEHVVDPETGVVTVEMMTPNLVADLLARGGLAVDGPGAGAQPTPPKPEVAPRARTGHAATPGAAAPAAAASTNTKGAAS
jgi:hypothetical protein